MAVSSILITPVVCSGQEYLLHCALSAQRWTWRSAGDSYGDLGSRHPPGRFGSMIRIRPSHGALQSPSHVAAVGTLIIVAVAAMITRVAIDDYQVRGRQIPRQTSLWTNSDAATVLWRWSGTWLDRSMYYIEATIMSSAGSMTQCFLLLRITSSPEHAVQSAAHYRNDIRVWRR